MKKILFFFIMIMFVLTACSNGQDPKEESLENVPALLEVSIITPEKIEINQEVSIKAQVSQGEEKVTNADEVKFEIWKSDQQDHEMLPAKNQKDGTYTIKKSFSEGGNYFIVAHTTANRMHSMPRKEVIVLGSESENGQATDEEKEDPDQHSDHEQHEHHNSEVSFDFHSPTTIKRNQQAELSVKLAQGEQLITGGSVRFEIWKENDTKHQFVDGKENSPGTYSTVFSFPSEGHFIVKIHVEKGNIHDHIEKSVDVKPS